MKKTLLTLFISALSLGVYAQHFEVPADYKLIAKEDYAPYEQDVVNCVDWITNTPLNMEADKRKDANAFLLKWVSGSPTVHIEIKEEVVTFLGSSPELLMVYLGGWTRYSLQSKDFDNKVEGSLAGIESVIDFYSKNKAFLPKDKNIEKYIKMKEKGKLREYIEKKA